VPRFFQPRIRKKVVLVRAAADMEEFAKKKGKELTRGAKQVLI
jgi:hypothetical protein